MKTNNTVNTETETVIITIEDVKKSIQSVNTKMNNIDSTIANNTLLMIVNFLKGKARKDYKELRKEIIGKTILNSYTKSVLNYAFKYKELKIVSKLDMIPFTKIKIITSIIEDDKKLIDTLRNLGVEDETKKDYLTKIDTFIENNKVVKKVVIDIEKESKKLLENLSVEDVKKLIDLLSVVNNTTK